MTQVYNTPQDAEDAYYDALEEGNLAQLIAVWADSDDICSLLPMYPLVQGREAVEEVYAHLFSHGQGVALSIRHLHWISAGEVAIHLVEESLQNPSPGQPPPPPFYAMNIYLREDDSWRMLAHQNAPTPPPQGR